VAFGHGHPLVIYIKGIFMTDFFSTFIVYQREYVLQVLVEFATLFCVVSIFKFSLQANSAKYWPSFPLHTSEELAAFSTS
jgi:hypothetical protein